MASSSSSQAVTPQMLLRLLRHELGGFLQTVYSTVAVLQRKLPSEWDAEHAMVDNLKCQAEECKVLLDTVHDSVFPTAPLTWEPVDLGPLTHMLAARARRRYAHLDVNADAPETPSLVMGDREQIMRLGSLLLTSACATARRRVEIRTLPHAEAKEVEWLVTGDDGWLPADGDPDPLASLVLSRRGHLELGLAPARHVVDAHGGRIAVRRMPGGGQSVSVILPKPANP